VGRKRRAPKRAVVKATIASISITKEEIKMLEQKGYGRKEKDNKT